MFGAVVQPLQSTLPGRADRNADGSVQHRIKHIYAAAASVVSYRGVDVVVKVEDEDDGIGLLDGQVLVDVEPDFVDVKIFRLVDAGVHLDDNKSLGLCWQ